MAHGGVRKWQKRNWKCVTTGAVPAARGSYLSVGVLW